MCFGGGGGGQLGGDKIDKTRMENYSGKETALMCKYIYHIAIKIMTFRFNKCQVSTIGFTYM